MRDRVSPNDLGAERALLGSVLLSSDVLPLVRSLVYAPEVFYRAGHRVIWSRLCRMADGGEMIDAVTLISALSVTGELGTAGGSDYVSTLTDAVATVVHAEMYAKIVVEAHRAREVIFAAQEIADRGLRLSEPVEEYVAWSQSRINAAARSDEGSSVAVSASQGASRALLAATSDEPPREVIHAGLGRVKLHRGVVHVIGGRPSNGKSVTAMNIADNVATSGGKVLVFALEDTAHRYYTRQLARFSGVSVETLVERRIPSADSEKVVGAANTVGQLGIWVSARKGVTVDWLRSFALAHRQKHGLDLVVIDYVQLLQKSGGYGTDEQTSIAHQLLPLSEELDAVVLALSQLRRPMQGNEKAEPTMFDLRQTGAWEQVAKWIGLLHYPCKYDEEEDPHRLILNVAKQSDGETGRRILRAEMASMWVGDADAADERGYQQSKIEY